jgi:O-antigen/teichoic acid export membrane protein
MWVGKDIKVPISISIVIAFYVILNGWSNIYSQFLNGVGKVQLQLYGSIFGAILNIPLAIFLGKHLGISGVILSTCFIGVINAVLSPIQYFKILNNRATGIWNK